MNVINRFALRLAPALAVASLCPRAFALENTGPTDPGSVSATDTVTSQTKQDSVKKEEEPKQGSRRTDIFVSASSVAWASLARSSSREW